MAKTLGVAERLTVRRPSAGRRGGRGLPGSDPAKTLLNAIARAGSTGESQSLGTPGELDNGLSAAAR